MMYLIRSLDYKDCYLKKNRIGVYTFNIYECIWDKLPNIYKNNRRIKIIIYFMNLSVRKNKL